MKSIIKNAIPLAASLLLLVGSPAFAARHHLDRETRTDDLIAPIYARKLPPSSSRDDNSSPYIGQWVEGYPRSAE
jgi:hypothetical protein